MKLLVLAVLARLCYCMLNENPDQFEFDFLQMLDSICEKSSYEHGFGSYQSSLQSVDFATAADMPLSQQEVYPYNQYIQESITYMEAPQNNVFLAGYSPILQSTDYSDGQPVEAPSFSSSGTTNPVPGLTSAGSLFEDLLQPAATNSVSTSSIFATTSTTLAKNSVSSSSFESVPSMTVVQPEHMNILATNQPASIANQFPDQPRQVSTSKSAKLRKAETIKYVSKLPLRLFINTLNAVSHAMGKEKIHSKSCTTKVLETTLARFGELFEILLQLEESKLAGNIGDIPIDKASLTSALERIKSHQKQEYRCTKLPSRSVLSVITGRKVEGLGPAECFKTLAELLVRYATLNYVEIPVVSFDDDGELAVGGRYFPDIQPVKKCRTEKSAQEMKRKRGASDEQPSSKRQKKANRKVDNAGLAHKRRNLTLIMKLYNYTSTSLKLKRVNVDRRPTMRYVAPFLRESLNALIDLAVNSGKKLIAKEIHEQYPITMELLKDVKNFFDTERMPSKSCATWFLRAFRIPNALDLNDLDKVYTIANWYAAVVMAILESIPTLRFNNGKVFIDNKPILPSSEDDK